MDFGGAALVAGMIGMLAVPMIALLAVLVVRQKRRAQLDPVYRQQLADRKAALHARRAATAEAWGEAFEAAAQDARKPTSMLNVNNPNSPLNPNHH